ncbi:hypothetical protein [Burkholderia phage BCSR5]|nr:hypothetical protein [Burkholderia phage BCSR5]
MSLKSKAKAAKQRERKQQEAAREAQRLADNANRLKTMSGGFSRSPVKRSTVQAFKASKMPQYVKQREVSHADGDRFLHMSAKTKPAVVGELTPEMQAREAMAQSYAREYKNRVAPAYNKGPDMLMSDSEYAAMKRGELRRRS